MYGQIEMQMINNKNSYLHFYDKISMIAKSLFTWRGLDKAGGNSRFLEKVLYEDGVACIVKDDKLGILSLRAIPSATLNNYELPTKIEAYSLNYHKQYSINEDNCVFILNNENMTPTIWLALYYSKKLWNIDQIIDVNTNAQKTPILIVGNKKQELTLRNLYMQYDGNVPAIFGNKDMDITNALNVLKTDAPFMGDKLVELKYEILTECLTFLGIKSTINPFKKERMVTNEVDYNKDLVNFILNCYYKTRKKACDEVNKKMGLNIDIEINKDIADLYFLDENEIMNYDGSDFDGEIYGDNQNVNRQ